MNRLKLTKISVCLLSGAVSLAGASVLAPPASAATTALSKQCNSYQRGYAQGVADAHCGGALNSGKVTDCNDLGGGHFNFVWTCGSGYEP